MAREDEVAKNQVDPKWARQFEAKQDALLAEIKSIKPGVQVVDQPQDLDRSTLTTPEQARRYDDMVDNDFYAIDFTVKPPRITDVKNIYRVVHIWPEFKTANSNEFIAKVVVEQWTWVRLADESKKRQIITSFNMYASEFEKKYKPTMVSSVSELNQ